MLFMVIERFRDNDMVPVYRRLRDSGRTLPEGLEYVDSWIEPNFSRCFQLMRCDDPRLFQQWALEWRGLGMSLEIVPVVTSKETRALVAPSATGASTIWTERVSCSSKVKAREKLIAEIAHLAAGQARRAAAIKSATCCAAEATSRPKIR